MRLNITNGVYTFIFFFFFTMKNESSNILSFCKYLTPPHYQKLIVMSGVGTGRVNPGLTCTPTVNIKKSNKKIFCHMSLKKKRKKRITSSRFMKNVKN